MKYQNDGIHMEDSSNREVKHLQIPGNSNQSENNFLDMTALIRSIQRSEGNPDCFGKAEGDCDKTDCAWREYCLGDLFKK